jgi:hypothetical protein
MRRRIDAEEDAMRVGLLNPSNFSLVISDQESFDHALGAVGLQRGQIDHGTLARLKDGGCIAYVVYEFGFFLDPAKTSYAVVMGSLIAGEAVIYQCNRKGDTVDLITLPSVTYYGRGATRIERIIESGLVKRPQTAIWSWPQPPSADIAARMKEQGKRPIGG